MQNIEKYTFPPRTRVLDAVLASSAVPVIFSPVTIEEHSFIDLCTFGAIPARTVKEKHNPDVIIATDTTPSYPLLKKFSPPSVKQFIESAQKSRDESKAVCDLVIEPKFPAGIIRFDKGEDFIEAGRAAAEEKIHQIKTLIGR